MKIDDVKQYLAGLGLDQNVQEFNESSATVELAAQAVGCEPCRIAKTMSFLVDGSPVLVVLAGDTRVDNPRFKATFHQKATMLSAEQVTAMLGMEVGGVCPFLAPKGVPVYLDRSLERFEKVYPSAGSRSSAVGLNLHELETASKADGWVDIGKC